MPTHLYEWLNTLKDRDEFYGGIDPCNGRPFVGSYSGDMFYEYWDGKDWIALRDEQEAKAAARIAHKAYEMGYRQAQRDIREALGIKGQL